MLRDLSWLAVALLFASLVAAHEVGDQVIVSHNGRDQWKRARRGPRRPSAISFAIQAIDGEWVRVNEDKRGWVEIRNVISLKLAMEQFSDGNRPSGPQDAGAYRGRAMARLSAGELDLAIADYDEALRARSQARLDLQRTRHRLELEERSRPSPWPTWRRRWNLIPTMGSSTATED